MTTLTFQYLCCFSLFLFWIQSNTQCLMLPFYGSLLCVGLYLIYLICFYFFSVFVRNVTLLTLLTYLVTYLFVYQLLMPSVDIITPSKVNKFLSTLTPRVPGNFLKHFCFCCLWSLQELLKKLWRFLFILYFTYPLQHKY